MQLIVNGQKKNVPEDLTVLGLLEHLKIESVRVAVEVNEEIVKKAEFPDHQLHEGDVIEILNFVGGG